jgi:outer membrane biosynthesis protein TonB
VDADFQQHYQAAERAYGLGDYTEAHALASALWNQLQSGSDEQDQSLVLGWRAVVALLLGHIQLHGLQQPEQAALSYQRVLESEPEATLAALAEQGLELCRSQNSVSAATTTPATDVAIPDLLKDPFLTTDPDQARPAQPHVVTAMPWLTSDEEPQPAPTTAPAPTPEPAVTLEPEITTEPADQPPSDEIEPTTQEPAAKDLLEKSWLRRQLQPAIKSPTDSTEPMGLMNRIKGAFARSAGR